MKVSREQEAALLAAGGTLTPLPVRLPPGPPRVPARGTRPPGDDGDLTPLLLAVRAAGFPEPEREYRFHPVRKYRFDLAFPALRVAFEREGGDFRPVTCAGCGRVKTVFVSRHHSRDGLEGDIEKYTAAMLLGWAVVRGTPGMIRDGRALAGLLAALEQRSRG